jgi:DNA replication and repair protein RecF
VRCQTLTLTNFRAHASGTFAFAGKINLLHGPNGAGKTNVLEAVHYAALTKSLLGTSDQLAVRRGADLFEVKASFATGEADLRVRIAYAPGGGKRVSVNGAPVERMADLVGRVPLVAMAPHDFQLTSGPPEERRRFLNNLIGQSRPAYLDDLSRYVRALRQRNELLSGAKFRRKPLSPELLSAWTGEVARLGAAVAHARARALEAFSDYVARAYELLGEAVEQPTLRYRPSGKPTQAALRDLPELESRMFDRLMESEPGDRERGRTLVGPHRDEVVFALDGLEVRRYASQGQHRTFGIALRLAQFFYLRDQTGKMPILLMDDLFGSLDAQRTHLMLELLASDEVGQSLLTHTSPTPLDQSVAFDDDAHRLLFVPRQPAAEGDGERAVESGL